MPSYRGNISGGGLGPFKYHRDELGAVVVTLAAAWEA